MTSNAHDMTMHTTQRLPMAYYKITRLATGGFVVKDGLHDNVFASTEIDAALIFVREKLAPDPLKADRGISLAPPRCIKFDPEWSIR